MSKDIYRQRIEYLEALIIKLATTPENTTRVLDEHELVDVELMKTEYPEAIQS